MSLVLFCKAWLNFCPTAPWSMTLASKVNLPHAIDVRALFGANLATLSWKIEPTKPLNFTVRGLAQIAWNNLWKIVNFWQIVDLDQGGGVPPALPERWFRLT